jgi:hypothetical protein
MVKYLKLRVIFYSEKIDETFFLPHPSPSTETTKIGGGEVPACTDMPVLQTHDTGMRQYTAGCVAHIGLI